MTDTIKSTSILSPQGQTTVPYRIRRYLELKPGSTITWLIQKDSLGIPQVSLIPPSAKVVESLRGIAKGMYGKSKNAVDAYINKERASWDF